MENSQEIGNGAAGEGILPCDGNDGELDGCEYFGGEFIIELKSVEQKEETFPNGLNRSLWIVLPDRRLDEGAVGVPHGTSHNMPRFTRPLQQHGCGNTRLCPVKYRSHVRS